MPSDDAAELDANDPRLEYKVVEVSVVTDEELEQVLNDVVRQGWTFDGIQFAMREASRRPSMAFVMFTRPRGG